MSAIETFGKSYAFNRTRTIELIEKIEKLPDPNGVLAWRPSAGRAHIGWQLMHIALTEDIFASRLDPKKVGKFTDLWPRFRGGSTPDDDVPSMAQIRETLTASRQQLREALGTLDETKLDEIPAALAEKQWSIRTVLYIINWHEGHHQGQAHATLNAYKAEHP